MKKPLLVVKTSHALGDKQFKLVSEEVRKTAESIGAEAIICDEGFGVGLHQDLSPLVEAMNKQTTLLSELLALARKSEERQARAERAHQTLREAQSRIARDLALDGGAVGAVLRGRQ